jgi:hypothetical protein
MLHVLQDEVDGRRHVEAGGDEVVEAGDIGVVTEATEQGDLTCHESHALGFANAIHSHLLQRHHVAAHHLNRFVHVVDHA